MLFAQRLNQYYAAMDKPGSKTRITRPAASFWRDQRGSGAAEYALILGILGIAVVLGAGAVELGVSNQLSRDAAAIGQSADAGSPSGGGSGTGGGNGNGNGNGSGGTPTPSPNPTGDPTPTPTTTPTPTPTATSNPGNGNGGGSNCKRDKTC